MIVVALDVLAFSGILWRKINFHALIVKEAI